MQPGTSKAQLVFIILHKSRQAVQEYYIITGPWNINGALLLLRPWAPDIPLHHMDFSGTADMWVQITGAPLRWNT